ncbi:MAG: 2OG-Fe(II) oxygenase family protein [Parvularculaceae bacterium]
MQEAAVEKPQVRAIFPTYILETRVKDWESLNSGLQAVIAQKRASDPGISRSNLGGWHSDTDMLRWGGEPARRLGLAALQLCGAYTHDKGMREAAPRFEMGLEMWANASPPGASNQMHAHPGCVWSAVYYVDDGGEAASGKLVLHDPRFPMNRMAAPDLVFAAEGEMEPMRVEIAPEPGKLVAFPSWLMHSVTAHQGRRERISIALNIMAIPVRKTKAGG